MAKWAAAFKKDKATGGKAVVAGKPVPKGLKAAMAKGMPPKVAKAAMARRESGKGRKRRPDGKFGSA